MRRTTDAWLTVAVLSGILAGCGADTPDGTLTKDQVSDQAKVEKTDTINNQVNCQDLDNAEDAIMSDPASDPDAEPVAISFNLSKGNAYEWVDNSVWDVGDPEEALAKVSAGIDACAKQYPENYAPIDSVKGFPDAVGYTAMENKPPVFTRRVLVPLENRVVVVGVRRDGLDAFTVTPEKLLEDAVAAAKKLDD
jgi:hypothetical protein